MLDWIKERYHEATVDAAAEDASRLQRRLMELVHTGVALAHKAMKDRLGLRAAMLSFWTALAVVPVLMLAFALTGPLGLTDTARVSLRSFLYETVLAESVEEVGGVLDSLLQSTSLRTVGLAGLAGLLLAGAQLYFTVERTYNELYGARVRRSPLLRFLVFYAAITLGPLLVAWGLINTTGLGDPGVAARLLSGVLTCGVLIAAIWLLPDTEVRWSAAFLGGVFSYLLFELAKKGFGLYMDLFGAESGIAVAFGSLAFIPFSLLWIFLVWMLVLLGVDLAYVMQHRSWQIAARQAADLDEDARPRWPDATFALAVMTLIGERFARGEGPGDPNQLSVRLGVEPAMVLTTLNVLEDAGLVVATNTGGFAPARPPDGVLGTDVLRAWRAHAGLSRASVDPTVRLVSARLEEVESALEVPLDALGRGGAPAKERA